MRLIALVFAAMIACGPVAAQNWRDYDYPDFAFGLAFPADPKIETTTYMAADGSAVEARVYSVEHENTLYKMTIADLSNTTVTEAQAIAHAMKMLAQSGEITVDIGHRINRVFGRQLSIKQKNGGYAQTAIFYYRKRLYQIEGTTLPTHSDPASGDAIRFQQSLRFTNNARRLFGFGTLFGSLGRLDGSQVEFRSR